MENYTVFSEVYDRLMNDVPYETWHSNIKKIWDKYGLKPELIVDLCCGSGTMTKLLADEGFDVIGIDKSFEMLMEARDKLPSNLFLNQNMTEFELYGTVDSIVCLCDSMNYLLEEKDVLKTLKLCDNYLNPNGLLIFDINTEFKFKNQLGTNIFGGNFEDFSYIWENYYDSEKKLHEYQTTFFMKNKNDLYQKSEETHYEKCYEIETIKNLILQSGMELVGVFDENLFEEPKEDSSRVYFVCKEIKK